MVFAFNREAGEVFRPVSSRNWIAALDEWRAAMKGRPNYYWHPEVASPAPKGHIMFAGKTGYEVLDAMPPPAARYNGYVIYAGQKVGWRTMFGEWFHGTVVGLDEGRPMSC